MQIGDPGHQCSAEESSKFITRVISVVLLGRGTRMGSPEPTVFVRNDESYGRIWLLNAPFWDGNRTIKSPGLGN